MDDNPPVDTVGISMPLASIENIQPEPYERLWTSEAVFTATLPQTLQIAQLFLEQQPLFFISLPSHRSLNSAASHREANLDLRVLVLSDLYTL